MSQEKFGICPLCRVDPASKKSSHIFPRFMGVTLLTTADGKRKGYTIGGNGKYKYDQDTPKEDYILCPTCESDIGKLEGKLANHLIYKLKEAKHASLFSHTKFPGYNKTFLPTIQNRDLKLAILSMLFRAHITSLKPFTNCILSDEQFSLIRLILNDEKYVDIPMLILTSGDQKYGENYYYAHTTSGHKVHALWVNDYLIFIVFDKSYPLIQTLPNLLLTDEDLPFLGCVPPTKWDDMRKGLMRAAKQINQGE